MQMLVTLGALFSAVLLPAVASLSLGDLQVPPAGFSLSLPVNEIHCWAMWRSRFKVFPSLFSEHRRDQNCSRVSDIHF